MIFDQPRNRELIDFIRAVAILTVVQFHVLLGFGRLVDTDVFFGFMDGYPGVFNYAWQGMGVDVIFMLSAFLLGLSLFGESQRTGGVDYRAHLVRRMSRVLPMYYLALILFAVGQGDATGDVIRSVFFVGFVFGSYNIIPVGWSMEVLIWVYLLLPFAVRGLVRARRPDLILLALGVATVVVRHVFLAVHPVGGADLYTQFYETGSFHPAMKEVYYRPWFRLTPFVIGLWLAWMCHRGLPQKARPAMIMLGAAVFGLVFWWPVHDPDHATFALLGEAGWRIYWAYSGAVGALGVAMVLLGSLGAAGNWRVPLSGLWTVIARNIFAIYLFHMPFIFVAAVVVFRSTDVARLADMTTLQSVLVFVLASALSLGFAIVMTRLIEQPLQGLLRRWFLPKEPTAN
ncbi:MAG: acyltransferase [Pseudomonadota bacterium]